MKEKIGFNEIETLDEDGNLIMKSSETSFFGPAGQELNNES